MGICMDTGRNRFLNGQEMAATQAAFGSWPRQLNGSLKYQRVVQQARTMSEPIMVVDSENRKSITPAESSSSGPEPPKRIPLTLQRKVAPLETSPSDVCVIFVLGGPGSGKITHCDRLMRMDERLFHLNMQTAFLEMASILGSRDPNIVPAYKALESLTEKMSELNEVGAIIVTGYPRNMRDVVEYMARIQRVDAVVLLDWSDRSLERQIQLGTKSGEIDATLARFEMNNYRSNIIPVAQFFDQQGLLHIVVGQRPPAEIFDDLAEEINGILSHALGEPAALAPLNGMGRPESVVFNGDRETSVAPEETRVVIHTSPEIPVKRKQSIDSVDIMIEEEIKHIEEEQNADTSVSVEPRNFSVESNVSVEPNGTAESLAEREIKVES